MKDYFILEIFPKLGHTFTDIEGNIEFTFENRRCVLITEDNAYKLKIPTGSRGFYSFPQYFPVNLYIEKDKSEENPFIIVEKICDVLSLATGNHIAYFTSRFSEYSHFSGWGIVKELPALTIGNSLKHKNSASIFLEGDLLHKIIGKIKLCRYKERILASLHMNKLAKYKAFSHITEAITDCINSIEALYMQEKGSYQSDPDLNIIPKNLKNNKTKILKHFLKEYYSGPEKDLSILDSIDFYKIRSGYLHRGFLLEPVSGDISSFFVNLEKANEFEIYNIFYKISFSTILNFVLTKC